MFDDFDPLSRMSAVNGCEVMTSEPQHQKQQFDDQFADILGGFEGNATDAVSDVSNTPTMASSEFLAESDIVECKAEDCPVAAETDFEEVISVLILVNFFKNLVKDIMIS